MNVKKEDFPIDTMKHVDETTNLPGISFFKSDAYSFSTLKAKKDTRIVAKKELQDKSKPSYHQYTDTLHISLKSENKHGIKSK